MVDAAIIDGLLTNLTPLICDEFSLYLSFEKDFLKLSSILTPLHAVLEDAERRIKLEEKDKQTEDWLRKLKDVAYEVRDIMGECTFEELRLQVKRLNASSSTRIQVTNCITHPFSNIWTRLKIGHKINDVLEKLEQVSSERNNLHLREIIRDKKSDNSHETISMLIEKVYGRDNEKEKIVDILVNGTEKLSVLPIFGLGGLGKTTLAKLVFNDEKITKCFDVKFWVCVSEVFDKSVVIKAIIGATIETSLEILQNKIQDELRGKKYLIVLDDVWNEDVGKWDELRGILDCGLNGSFIITTTRKRNVAKVMKYMVQPFELSLLSDDDCWQLFEERAFMYGIPKTISYIGIGKEIAQKCKGIPLIAKTLGSQLGFKRDQKDWCTIRDSEMWQIFENEESILPILSLSYYDLPYHLRRCFTFCAIFPKDIEIEKEMLIQLWMAHDLIPLNKNQEREDLGNTIWDELCWRSYFQDKKEETNWYRKEVQKTCKIQDYMHHLAQCIMMDECYTMNDDSSGEDFRREIRHIMVDESSKISIDSLKKIGGLQSIILLPQNYGTLSKEILSVLKEHTSLRALQVSFGVQSQDLRYVGGLKHLRYLNISGSEITTLPNSICDLLNLQTLNLNDCEFLESLPKNTKDLINLRHLHLKGCNGLKYMPRGMGRLRHLKTLSLFVIGKESDGQLDELKELNIGGYMEIGNLEMVSDEFIARGGMTTLESNMNQLVLHWNNESRHDDNERQSRDEKICEAFEYSAAGELKTLGMRGYKGVNIPKWVGESSASLTMLHLSDLDNVEHIFTMKNRNEMVLLFPFLKELSISKMKNLRELVSPPIPITTATTATTVRAFPNLCKIEINYCPKLGALSPHLKSLKDLSVEGECSVALFDSISDLSGQFTRLSLSNVNERRVLFPSASTSSNDMNGTLVTLFPLLEEFVIENMKNLRELVPPPIPTTSRVFPNLCKIVINRCPKLGALPLHLNSLKDVTVKGQCSDELLYSISNLIGLTHLTLMFMEERSVLFGGGGNYYHKADENENENENENEITSLSTFRSLKHLEIHFCYKLSCLFDEKYLGSDCLRNLNSLTIIGCRNLTILSLEQLRNITHSLRSLDISLCPKLVPSELEADERVIALLRSLRKTLGKKFRGDIRQGRRCRYCTPLKKEMAVTEMENFNVDHILNEEDGEGQCSYN